MGRHFSHFTSLVYCITFWDIRGLSSFSVPQGSSSPASGNASTTQVPCVPKVQPVEWTKENFPNPQVDIDKCGRNCQKSWICDPNSVLTNPSRTQSIENLLSRARVSGHCGCPPCNGKGFKISVALINRMKFQSWELVSSDKKTQRAMEFASYLRSTAWHPAGTCKDDVVIFVSRGDRKVQTAVGPQAINILTPECLEDVYNSAKSDLSRGDFDDAIYYMAQRYEQAFVSGNCDSESEGLSAGAIVGIVIGIIAFFVFIIVACVCCGCCRGGGGGGRFHHSNWGRSSWGGGGGGGGGGFSFGGSGDGGGSGGGDF